MSETNEDKNKVSKIQWDELTWEKAKCRQKESEEKFGVPPVFRKDGETVSVIVDFGGSCFDPCRQYPAIIRTYRIISCVTSGMLELIPLNDPMYLDEDYSPTPGPKSQKVLIEMMYQPKKKTSPDSFKMFEYVFKCPEHGIFASSQKFDLPDLDKDKTSDCLVKTCLLTCTFAGFQPVLESQKHDG
jgi:hypothetical protein